MTEHTTHKQQTVHGGNTMVNGIELATLQATVDAIAAEPGLGQCRFRARNQWQGGSRNRTTVKGFYGAGQEIAHKQDFELQADEPQILAGHDDGANPVEHLLNALAACATTSMVAHAAVRGIEIRELESEIEGDLDLRGFLGLDNDVPRGFMDIRIRFRVDADQDNLAQLQRLTAFSPVVNTVTNGAPVNIEVVAK